MIAAVIFDMKRFSNVTGTVGPRHVQQNNFSSKQYTQDRWGSQERYTDGDSQNLTQLSSQRTQLASSSSSSQTNQFETILATQRHAEVMTYLKQFSRAASENNHNQTAAIAECNAHLQVMSKNVAGFSADARRLESSNREQLAYMEKEISTIHQMISDLSSNIKESSGQSRSVQPVDADSKLRAAPCLDLSTSTTHIVQETEDGICVIDYLLEVQKRRLQSTAAPRAQYPAITAPIPAVGGHQPPCNDRRKDEDSEVFDELFEEELDPVSPPPSKTRQHSHCVAQDQYLSSNKASVHGGRNRGVEGERVRQQAGGSINTPRKKAEITMTAAVTNTKPAKWSSERGYTAVRNDNGSSNRGRSDERDAFDSTARGQRVDARGIYGSGAAADSNRTYSRSPRQADFQRPIQSREKRKHQSRYSEQDLCLRVPPTKTQSIGWTRKGDANSLEETDVRTIQSIRSRF